MKIILTEDVYKHGVAGEIVDVANGFARNYLIPQGKGIKATPGALKQMEKLRAEAANRRQLRDRELQELGEKVEALTISFPVKAGERGKLYGSVTSGNIAEAIEAELGLSIDRRRIGEQPLRELGQHSVVVRLSSALNPSITVLVHREDEPPESVLDMVPTGEVEEELAFFEEVIGEDEEEEIDSQEAEDEAADELEEESGPELDMSEDSEPEIDIPEDD
jgi:large subunit ribosomal protein L9